MIFEALFWFSLSILAYVYFGFMAILLVLSRFLRKPVLKSEITPSVSIIICAFNEEAHIREKLKNCSELDYPKEQLEIIIVSDGSNDGTNKILESLKGPSLKMHFMSQRRGKSACQNIAVSIAKNEVLFFTDATIMHPPETLKVLLRGLYDPSVGCVTGKPVFKRDKGVTSVGLTKRDRYELYLRNKLGEINTLFGAQDCIYVIPRRLYQPVRDDLDSGFVGPLQILEQGYRTLFEPEALAYVNRDAPKIKDEFIRRSRIVLRGMRGLFFMRQLMNPFRYGFLAISLISSRLLRWLTPIFLVTLLISNAVLVNSLFYLTVFLLQIVFYLLAGIAFFLERHNRHVGTFFSIPLYFCLLACSAANGLKRLMLRETGQMWQTRR